MSRRLRFVQKLIKTRNGRIGVLVTVCFTALMLFLHQKISTNNEILTALESRNGTELVNPFGETTIFQPIKRCQSNGSGKLAVILVTTLPHSTDRRDTIRKTWAKWSTEYGMILFFFSGRPNDRSNMQKLEDEVYRHEDLILENLQENYHKLTIKTLRMLKWFLNQCSDAKFLIKVDDDVFINIPNMAMHLEDVLKSPQYSNYIGGMVHKGREPHDVNPFSKWYIPSQLWPTGETYPPYTGGPCYVLSAKVAPKLYKEALVTPLINLEDVFLTGVVGYKQLGIQAQNIPRMYDAHYPRLNYYWSTDTEIQSFNTFHADGDNELIFLLYKPDKAS